MNEVVFLVGFMGSGKSTIGKALAEILQYSFVDTDEEVEKIAGCSIQELFTRFGESHFREIEHQVVVRCLARRKIVVGCGGGLPCFHDNMKTLNTVGVSIYLDADFNMLYERIKDSERPLVKNVDAESPRAELKQLLEKRLDVYRQAKYTVECGVLEPAEIADTILSQIQARL